MRIVWRQRRQRQKHEADLRVGDARGVVRIGSPGGSERLHFSGRAGDVDAHAAEHGLAEPGLDVTPRVVGIGDQRLDALARARVISEANPPAVVGVEAGRDGRQPRSVVVEPWRVGRRRELVVRQLDGDGLLRGGLRPAQLGVTRAHAVRPIRCPGTARKEEQSEHPDEALEQAGHPGGAVATP